MRSGQVIGAALLILALGAGSDAEARGRIGARRATIGTAAVVATGSIGVASAAAEAGPSAPVAPPVKAVPAPPDAVREVSAPAPWCATRRLVGTGTGFCLIN